jgi:hypothetical protein
MLLTLKVAIFMCASESLWTGVGWQALAAVAASLSGAAERRQIPSRCAVPEISVYSDNSRSVHCAEGQ